MSLYMWTNFVHLLTSQENNLKEHLHSLRDSSLMDKFLHASDRVADFLASQIDKDGFLKDRTVSGDLCSQYKLATLLLISGHSVEGQRLLDRIKQDFLRPDGDFLSYPNKEGRDRKSSSFAMCEFWTYMNAWIAMGAHRYGRFDISVPAYTYCKRFYNPDQKAVCVSEQFSEITADSTMDCLSTAHFGLLSLYMGDISTAKDCGERLLKFVEDQPDFEKQLYLRMSAETGQILTTLPDKMDPFYVVKKDSPNQLYFFLGYHAVFMTKLYRATNDERFLKSAQTILDFALSCHESMATFSFSHKVAYAAALVAVETKNPKYRRLAIGLCEYLVSIQLDNGLFGKDFELIDRYDQSAEIGVWLRETVGELKKIM